MLYNVTETVSVAKCFATVGTNEHTQPVLRKYKLLLDNKYCGKSLFQTKYLLA
jgi:hypothetical protein